MPVSITLEAIAVAPESVPLLPGKHPLKNLSAPPRDRVNRVKI
ncbi:hypothetical protein [Oxynema sp. CENA135]|nr:hypothetical protein [Oxynema sp. CENA135]